MTNFLSKNSFGTGFIENNHPSFLMIPFRTEDIFTNSRIQNENRLQTILEQRHPNKFITITFNGREALRIVLNEIEKKESANFNVRIQTTSDNIYVSSCVTKEIERNNKWNREKSSNSNVLLINHEFGYVDNRITEKKHNEKYLVEDCAFSFNSKNSGGELCGNHSDFAVFSFSKFFPIQFGGYLVSDYPIEHNFSGPEVEYIGKVVSNYSLKVEAWSEHRLSMKKYYNEVFGQLGCISEFDDSKLNIPGAYIFKLPNGIDKNLLKSYFWSRGIQSTAFYGKESFILPLHQFTTKNHIEYYADLMEFHIKNHDK